MRPINVAISFSTPDYRTVITLIQAICPFLLFLANFMFIWCIYYIHVLPILCFYTHTVKINFSVHLLLIIKKEKNSKINNDDYHQFFSFFFLVLVLLNLCNACLLLFVLFISLCDLAFIYYRSKQQQQQKTNKPCGWLCGAIVHFFLKQRIIRALKKEWRRIIGKWIKIYLILFCFSCYYHSFAYVLPILGMI
jgi:hypothetical protein